MFQAWDVASKIQQDTFLISASRPDKLGSGISLGSLWGTRCSFLALLWMWPFPGLQQEATVNYIHYIISYYLLYSDSTYNCFTAFKMLVYSSVPQFSANTPAHCDSVEQETSLLISIFRTPKISYTSRQALSLNAAWCRGYGLLLYGPCWAKVQPT